MDKDRLIKLLNLTSSDNDNEAISALRKANAMLKEGNLTWGDLIGVQKAIVPEGPVGRPYYSSSMASAYEEALKQFRDSAMYARQAQEDAIYRAQAQSQRPYTPEEMAQAGQSQSNQYQKNHSAGLNFREIFRDFF